MHSRKHICNSHKPKQSQKLQKSFHLSSPDNRFESGFWIAHAQKNKINLCYVDKFTQTKNDLK